MQCPWCEGGLYNWVEGDTAFVEHAKHFPSCPFVNSSTNKPVVSVVTPSTNIFHPVHLWCPDMRQRLTPRQTEL